MGIIRKVIDLLNYKEKKRAFLLFFLIFVMALFDMLGVASILPFIAVLSNPQIIETNNFLNYLYSFFKSFGGTSVYQFQFFLGIGVFFFLIISLIFKAFTTYAQFHYSLMREFSIGKKLIEGYLRQPYQWFLTRDSSDLGKTILSEVETVVNLTIIPLMIVIAQSTVVILLLILLLLINPLLAVSVGFIMGTSYALIYLFTKNKLFQIGKIRLQLNADRFKIISEIFEAVKIIKVSALEKFYLHYYSSPSNNYAKIQSQAKMISLLPRYFIEGIAFGGMIILILVLMLSSNNFINIIPIIAVYAFAGYRLMPSLQQIYYAITEIRYSKPILDSIHKDLTSLNNESTLENKKKDSDIFNKVLTLKNVAYKYPNSDSFALKNINIDLPLNSKIGIVGITGSGKSTFVDIILGLLKPTEGEFMIDRNSMNFKNIRSWQNKIGYVPQNIFLHNGTIATNIAFGLNEKDIDHKQIEKVAKISNLFDFINDDLPNKYKTVIGEKGINLSGGQKQRIGIARALYHEPKILILDEATSALDNITEKLIMSSLDNLEYEKTIILITHRLSTIQNCDFIILFDKGEIKSIGNFKDLSQNNKLFKEMLNKND
jgi:ABC-type multidrug transport system fused ATPase/permease subunit